MDDIYQRKLVLEQVREHEQVREQGRVQVQGRERVQVLEREQVREQVHQQLRFFHPFVLGLLVEEGYRYRGYFHTASR